jgi:hypothetical protein
MNKVPCIYIVTLLLFYGVLFSGCSETKLPTAEQFKHPPSHYRMNLITHEAPLDKAQQDSLLNDLLASGYGGMATNVKWSDSYLKNEEEWGSFRRFVHEAKDRNMELWLYDEKGYPSGMAGEYVLAEHPEWEAEGLFFKDTVVNGPAQLKTGLLPGETWIVSAFPMKGDALLFGEGRDLLPYVNNGRLDWMIPPGKWKIAMISAGVLYHGFQAGTDRIGVPRYPSLLMPEVTERFIELTHRKYAEVFGGKLERYFLSTFTDEPSSMALTFEQLGYGVLPWKENVSAEFERRYGYRLKDRLIPLMLDEGNEGKKTRVQYLSIISDFMSRHYFQAIKEYCRTQGIRSGGHLLLEESMMAHVPLYGDIMSCYREMDVPGIDVLTCIPDYTRHYLYSGRLAASAAELEGNSMVMSEVCPVVDHYLTGAEAPTLHTGATINRQLVAGVTKFNNYLQLQHEDHAGKTAFNTYIARVCMMISGGVRASRIAVYYPVETLWSKYLPQPASMVNFFTIGGGHPSAQHLDSLFVNVSEALFEHQWEFSYIDMKGICESTVENGQLHHGNLHWDVLILPGTETLSEEAMNKIALFAQNGGKVVAMEALPQNSTSDFPSVSIRKSVAGMAGNIYFEPQFNKDHFEDLLNGILDKEIQVDPGDHILSCHKYKNGKDVYLLVNDSSQPKDLSVKIKRHPSLTCWNPQTGELYPLEGEEIKLGAYESIILTEK